MKTFLYWQDKICIEYLNMYTTGVPFFMTRCRICGKEKINSLWSAPLIGNYCSFKCHTVALASYHLAFLFLISFLIFQIWASLVSECYLLKKKVRGLVLLNKVKDKFVPISVIRKETNKGNNISKETYIDIFYQNILKIMKEIEEENYEVVEL